MGSAAAGAGLVCTQSPDYFRYPHCPAMPPSVDTDTVEADKKVVCVSTELPVNVEAEAQEADKGAAPAATNDDQPSVVNNEVIDNNLPEVSNPPQTPSMAIAPEAVSESTPEAVAETTPEAVAKTTPEAVAKTTPEAVQEAVHEAAPVAAEGNAVEKLSQAVLESAP